MEPNSGKLSSLSESDPRSGNRCSVFAFDAKQPARCGINLLMSKEVIDNTDTRVFFFTSFEMLEDCGVPLIQSASCTPGIILTISSKQFRSWRMAGRLIPRSSTFSYTPIHETRILLRANTISILICVYMSQTLMIKKTTAQL